MRRTQFDDWSPSEMARLFTPQRAAHVKALVFMLRCATDQESLNYSDRVIEGDGGHRWFTYCLDAVARRA